MDLHHESCIEMGFSALCCSLCNRSGVEWIDLERRSEIRDPGYAHG